MAEGGFSVEIDTHQLEEFAAKIPNAGPLVSDFMSEAVRTGTEILYPAAIEATPEASGFLRSTIHTEFRGGFFSGFEGEVIASAEYAHEVEYGRPAGTPPSPTDIERWMGFKGGFSDDGQGNVAFLISRAIGERGIPGVFMFQKALDEMRENIWEAVQSLAEGLMGKIDEVLR